jgi:hypothetical protein
VTADVRAISQFSFAEADPKKVNLNWSDIRALPILIVSVTERPTPSRPGKMECAAIFAERRLLSMCALIAAGNIQRSAGKIPFDLKAS